MSARLGFIGSADPWAGGLVQPGVQCVLAPNPGPMTLDGTNTWIIGSPGAAEVVVVDPGPADGGHLDLVLQQVRDRGARVGQVLLTHGHADHSAGARAFGQLARAAVRALDPAHLYGGEGLAAGDVVPAGDWTLRVVATPGHSHDSLSFHLDGAAALLTGDTVLGRGTTVVAHPDGRLDDYLASLRLLRREAQQTGARRVLPGHGPALVEPARLIDDYLEHRVQRLEQVRQALAAGAGTVREIVELVYAEVPRAAWPAAEMSVAAQLAYLRGGRATGIAD